MSDEDYRDVPRKNSEVRALAARVRSFFGVADAEHVDVLDCASRSEIWTVKGVNHSGSIPCRTTRWPVMPV